MDRRLLACIETLLLLDVALLAYVRNVTLTLYLTLVAKRS